MYKNWLRRLAATGAALSVGGMALLCGCNHDKDCDSCDTHPVVGPRVSDTTVIDEETPQPTSFGDNPVVAAPDTYESDIYFRDHRNDPNFDRDAYFRDRAAYIRAHEGDAYWNDHRVELEKSWRPGFRADADIYFRDHRNDPNFDRDAYFRDRGAYIRAHEGDAYWNDHRAEFEKSWNTGFNADGDIYLREHRNDPKFDRDAYMRDRAGYVRSHEGDKYWNDHRTELENSWGTGVRANVNSDNQNVDRNANTAPANRENFNKNTEPANAAADRNANRDMNRDMNNQPRNDLNANAPKSDTNLNTNNTEVKSRSDANLPKSDANAPKADVKTPPVRSSTEAGATMPEANKSANSNTNLKEQEPLNTSNNSTSSTSNSSSASNTSTDLNKNNADKLDHNDAAKFEHNDAAKSSSNNAGSEVKSNEMKDQGKALNTSNNTSSAGTSATSTSSAPKSSNNPGSETNGSAGAPGTTAPGSSSKGTSNSGSKDTSSGASSGGM